MSFFVAPPQRVENALYFDENLPVADLLRVNITATLDGYFYPVPIEVDLASEKFVCTIAANMNTGIASPTIHNAVMNFFATDLNGQLVPVFGGMYIGQSWVTTAPYISASAVVADGVGATNINGTSTAQFTYNTTASSMYSALKTSDPANFDFNNALITQTTGNLIKQNISLLQPAFGVKKVFCMLGWTKGTNVVPGAEIVDAKFTMVQI